jgi:hypothetical protein
VGRIAAGPGSVGEEVSNHVGELRRILISQSRSSALDGCREEGFVLCSTATAPMNSTLLAQLAP